MSGPVIYPAAVAIDCTALFSRMVMSLDTCNRESVRNMTNDMMTLVTPTPSVQPVFAPM